MDGGIGALVVLDWTIDLELGEIRDGSGGHVALRRRQFDLLLYLAQRHDRLVTKDELIAAVWHGVAVSDDALTKCVSEVRQALGEGRRDTLQTLPGRGYMLSGWHRDKPQRLVLSRARPEVRSPLPPPRHLVGRDTDLGALAALVGRRRMVTITGSGGVGKTSLALAVANRVAADFPDGIVMVHLAPLLGDGSVASAILAALGVAAEADPMEAVLAHLMGRHILLVLDNCEHLVEAAAAATARILNATPNVHLLVTSREPLAVEDETVFRLQALPYPATADGLDAEAALGYPAIELLALRLAAVADDFVLTDADVATAVEICRRLDGIPLALVLAAAQFRAMRLDEVAARLDQRFELLIGGQRDADPRQRTLREMVAWSVDLLSASEQALYAQIGVFAGPASLDDIAAVCHIAGRSPTAAEIVALTDKSLLNIHRDAAAPTRYGYFETTRQFALEKLGADSGARRRHAEHLVAVLTQGEIDLEVSATEAWRRAYGPYLDDLRTALAWASSAAGDSRLALELSLRGAGLLDELSLQSERRGLIERAAALPEAGQSPAMAGRLKLTQALLTGWVVWDGGLSHEAADQFALSGERLLEGRARAVAAASDGFIAAWDRVWPGFEAAERLLRPFGATRSLSNALRYKATLLIWQGRLDEAVPPLEEAGRIADAIGYFTGSVRARATFGEIAFERGDMPAAIASSLAELAEVAERGSLSDVQSALTTLAAYQLLGGEAAAAVDTLVRVFDVDRRLGDRLAASLHFELAAFSLALRGDLDGAAALSGFARALNADAPRPPERYEQVVRHRMQQLMAPLPPNLRIAADARAIGWSPDQALAVALEKLTQR